MVTVRVSYTAPAAPKYISEWFNVDLKEMQFGAGRGVGGWTRLARITTNTCGWDNELLGSFKGGEFWLDKKGSAPVS
jgi:hypothetical protein